MCGADPPLALLMVVWLVMKRGNHDQGGSSSERFFLYLPFFTIGAFVLLDHCMEYLTATVWLVPALLAR